MKFPANLLPFMTDLLSNPSRLFGRAISLLATLLLLFSAVPAEAAKKCDYEMSPTARSHLASGGSDTISITKLTNGGGCNWTATSNVSWITITSGGSGSGSGSVSYTVAANSSTSSRSGTITVAGQTFTVSQAAATVGCDPSSVPPTPTGLTATAVSSSQINLQWEDSSECEDGVEVWQYTASRGSWVMTTVGPNVTTYNDSGLDADSLYRYFVRAFNTAGKSGWSNAAEATTEGGGTSCTYAINPSSISYTAAGGSGSVSVTVSSSSCSWTAVSNVSWITVTGGASSSGNGKAYYTVDANSSTSSRSGTITVAGETFTVSQAAATVGCDPSSVPPTPTGLTATAVSSSQINLQWEDGSDCEDGFEVWQYTASRGSWVMTTVGPNVTAYSDSGLVADSLYRYFVRTFNTAGKSDWSNAAEATTDSGGTTCTYSISPTSASYSAAGGSGSISVLAGSGCSWTASESLSWVSITAGSSGSGNGTVYYTVEANSSTSSRSGTFTVAGKVFTITQTAAEDGWVMALGGQGQDWAYSVAVDGNDNKLVVGLFTDSASFGGAVLTSAGGYDMFLAKYDSSGNHLWSRRYGASGSEMPFAIALDGAGNIVVTGWFTQDGNFGGSTKTSGSGSPDIFLAKYNASGSHLWSKSFGSPYARDDRGLAVAVDGGNNIVFTGYFGSAVDFGGGYIGHNDQRNVFLAKYSASGSHLWSKNFGRSGSDTGEDVIVDGNDDLIVIGRFGGTGFSGIDFGSGPMSSVGSTDVFVAKLRGSDGGHIWSKQFGGTNQDYAQAVALDSGGNAVVTGCFMNTADFEAGSLTSAGWFDVFVMKLLGSDGTAIWARRFGGAEIDMVHDVAIGSDNHPVVTGEFKASVNFGGGTVTSAGQSDCFVTKLSGSNGNHLWSTRGGGSGNDAGQGVAVGSNNVVVTGQFEATADFEGASLTSDGFSEIFLLQTQP